MGRGLAADEDDRADDGTSSTKELANGSTYQKKKYLTFDGNHEIP